MFRTKPFLSGLCALVLMLTWLLSANAASLKFPFETVTNDTVNMRKNASANALILERLQKGDAVTVTGESGKYYQVIYKSREGYILKEYLSTDETDVVVLTPTPQPVVDSYPYETDTNDEVNLRTRKSLYSDILVRIPKGASVTVTAVSGTWAAVKYKKYEGFVKNSYVNLKKVVAPTKTPKPTPTPTPVPTLSAQENASYYSVLEAGSSGHAVRALQEALKELGYYSGDITSVFDSDTTSAVLAFQKKNKYPETGVVDANLQAFLYSGKPLNNRGTKTKVKTLAPVSGVTITSGAKGEFVGEIQLRLHELGYYSGSITEVYDANTRKAMTAFQKLNSLTANAVCDLATQDVLFSASAYPASVTATPKPTHTPKPSPTFQVPSASVKRGSKGADAKLVQQRLKDLGYFTYKVDGNFGSHSVAALKDFQKSHGLTADGVAGNATFALLFSYNALAKGQTPSPVPSPTPSPTPEPTEVPTPYAGLTEENAVRIVLGTTGEEVRRLQMALSALGYYESSLDGVYKAEDEAAVKRFQQLNGLTVDGIAGYATQARLYSTSAVSYIAYLESTTPAPASASLKKGATGDAVKELQNRLIALGYLYGVADGVYGTATARAVAAFQAANKLSKDGVAGARTLAKLYDASAVRPTATPAKTAAAPAATATPSVLKRGDKSDAVKALQTRLIALGYLQGKADGVFGLDTYRALVSFQRNNKLATDGVAGTATLAQLSSDSVKTANGTTAVPEVTVAPTATPVPTAPPAVSSASSVIYANWYTTIKSVAKQYQYATVYDIATGISWQVHMFSLGAHADVEPLTAMDTAKMLRAFGSETWEPRAVWVSFSNGQTYIGSTHSNPHGTQHITDNNFSGHTCIHFPRTSAQVAAIGPYATRHQTTIDTAWSTTQAMR